ncbi:hypothetical protein [Sphingomonas sp. DT-204]|uniref:hypothetical protein n=1 Tax=Sphingomonas sp. DT-204 TaxID=3396166 RepID=UPI003F1BBA61
MIRVHQMVDTTAGFVGLPTELYCDPFSLAIRRGESERGKQVQGMATNAIPRRKPSRWNVAARAVAAMPINYLLTSLATAWLARVLPGPRHEASVAATLISFALFAALVLIAFAIRSLARLWLGMIAVSAVLGALLWFSLATGGRL